MPGCGQCGEKVPIVGNQVGRRDTCGACCAELHACRSCRHFEPTLAKQCKEPFAEVPSDKDDANFCDLFQIGEGGRNDQAAKDSLLAAAESLFKKV